MFKKRCQKNNKLFKIHYAKHKEIHVSVYLVAHLHKINYLNKLIVIDRLKVNREVLVPNFQNYIIQIRPRYCPHISKILRCKKTFQNQINILKKNIHFKKEHEKNYISIYYILIYCFLNFYN
jgi:hypothetical protein